MRPCMVRGRPRGLYIYQVLAAPAAAAAPQQAGLRAGLQQAVSRAAHPAHPATPKSLKGPHHCKAGNGVALMLGTPSEEDGSASPTPLARLLASQRTAPLRCDHGGLQPAGQSGSALLAQSGVFQPSRRPGPGPRAPCSGAERSIVMALCGGAPGARVLGRTSVRLEHGSRPPARPRHQSREPARRTEPLRRAKSPSKAVEAPCFQCSSSKTVHLSAQVCAGHADVRTDSGFAARQCFH